MNSSNLSLLERDSHLQLYTKLLSHQAPVDIWIQMETQIIVVKNQGVTKQYKDTDIGNKPLGGGCGNRGERKQRKSGE